MKPSGTLEIATQAPLKVGNNYYGVTSAGGTTAYGTAYSIKP